MLYDISLKDTIEKSFTQYSGAVIQSRALVDVRDCVKPSARQIYYSLFTDGFTHDKPFKKTLKAIGSCMKFYVHGDASCEGVIMRSGQPFSLRYPLVEIEGSYGNLTETGNWAASRYTAARLSDVANYLIQNANTHTVNEWVDNYDDTEQYPRILPSLGFYNIVNGTTGIAVGTASSIPQFNLREVNEAMKKLVEDPDADFEDVFCYPDFATGGKIINKEEVKESLRQGQGKACVIRAVISYNKKDNALVISEMPYGVYTNTICSEIEKLALADEELGIININDLTGEQPNVKIYLSKSYKNKIEKITNLIDFLYEKTSLQKSFSVNMTMLEDGRYPKVFGWKEALLAHIDHERATYTNLFTYQKEKLSYRLMIVNGILCAIESIDNVVNTIRNAASTEQARNSLIELLNINEDQAKAILDIKLVRLAKLETSKFLNEKENLEKEISKLTAILESKELLNQEMIKKFDEVSNKFGDDRRTEVIQMDIVKQEKVKAKKQRVPEPCVVTFNPLGYLQNIPMTNFRKTDFTAIKCITEDMILLFSNKGNFFRIAARDIKSCGNKDKGTAIGTLITLEQGEKILAMFANRVNESKPYVFFAMSNGMVKKSEMSQYTGTTRNKKGMIATKAKCDIAGIAETNGNDIVLESSSNYFLRFAAEEVRPTGRNSSGVKGMILEDGQYIKNLYVINQNDNWNEVPRQKRSGKGKVYEIH